MSILLPAFITLTLLIGPAIGEGRERGDRGDRGKKVEKRDHVRDRGARKAHHKQRRGGHRSSRTVYRHHPHSYYDSYYGYPRGSGFYIDFGPGFGFGFSNGGYYDRYDYGPRYYNHGPHYYRHHRHHRRY